jgi:hypothetical protein
VRHWQPNHTFPKEPTIDIANLCFAVIAASTAMGKVVHGSNACYALLIPAARAPRSNASVSRAMAASCSPFRNIVTMSIRNRS